jgi:F-type H+-transporting ATPase subunit a
VVRGYALSNLYPMNCNVLTVPLTTITAMVVLNILLVMLWIGFVNSIHKTNIAKVITQESFSFIVTVLQDSVYIKKYSFILLFYTAFALLCLSNLIGMLPYSITVTSHLILTLFFSLALFLGSNVIGVCYLKQSFFSLFLPEGVPLLITPFLILIEYVSYVSRIFSLAIRLFANMLSGHILLKILISFV